MPSSPSPEARELIEGPWYTPTPPWEGLPLSSAPLSLTEDPGSFWNMQKPNL